MLSIKKLVNPMKFFPQESKIEKTVPASSAHFMGPFTIKSPNINNVNTKAPTYTGPEVPGCSPQY